MEKLFERYAGLLLASVYEMEDFPDLPDGIFLSFLSGLELEKFQASLEANKIHREHPEFRSLFLEMISKSKDGGIVDLFGCDAPVPEFLQNDGGYEKCAAFCNKLNGAESALYWKPAYCWFYTHEDIARGLSNWYYPEAHYWAKDFTPEQAKEMAISQLKREKI